MKDGPRDHRQGGTWLTPRGHADGAVSHWATNVLSTPPLIRFAFSVMLVVLVATVDRVTGHEISFSIFYLLPVSFAARLLSGRAGRLVSVLSAGAWGFP